MNQLLNLYLEYTFQKKYFVLENFIRSSVEKYGRYIVYTDGGTWYPQTCDFLYLKHRFHLTLEKSLEEREQCSISRIGLKVLMIIILVLLNQKRNCDLHIG